MTTFATTVLDVRKKFHIVYILAGEQVDIIETAGEYTTKEDPTAAMAKVLVPTSNLPVLGAFRTYNTIRIGDVALVQKIYEEAGVESGFYLIQGIVNRV